MIDFKNINGAIFVISLPNSPRRKHIVSEFAKHSLTFEFIDAVVGKQLDIDNDVRINSKRVKENDLALNLGMIGASLSHIKCYQRIISDNLDFALIFEDDVAFKDNIQIILPEVIKASTRTGITMMFYQSNSDIELDSKSAVPVGRDTYIYDFKKDQIIFSATAYVMWKEPAKKLVDYLLPVFSAPDSWAQFKRHGIIDDIKLVYPMPCYNACFATEITYPTKTKIRIIDPLVKVISKWNIPFLQNYLKSRRQKLYTSTQKVKIK